MGVTGLFAALADVLAPAAEAAAPEALGAAAADTGLTASVLGPVAGAGLDVPLTASVLGPAEAATGAAAGTGLAAADLIPESTGAGLSGLALDTGGSTLASSSLGPLAGELAGPGVGAAGATPAAGIGGGFSGVLGTGTAGTQFGDLSALLAPTGDFSLLGSDPLAAGISPASFTPAQPGLLSQDFTALAGQGAPSFLSQVSTPLTPVTETTPFAPASSSLAQSLGLDISPSVPGSAPIPTGAPQIATDVAPPVAPINSLEAAGMPNLPAGPPSWFDPMAPGLQPPGPGAAGIATAAPETVPPAAAPAAETAAAAPAAAAPGTLSTLSQYAPLGSLALGGAGLGLNVARTLGQPTAANVAQAPASNALAQTAPAMDANQMRQLLLNEGMSPAQADAYIAQINQRLAAQGATTGSTDALNQGLVTAG